MRSSVRRRNAATNRIALAMAAGTRAVASGDWRAMVAACRDNDAAYLAFRALQAQAGDVVRDTQMKEREQMTTAIFGKPETAGVVIGVDPLLIEHAEIVKRAIDTLEMLGERGIIKNDGSVISLFVEQSWDDLTRLLKYYQAQGVQLKDLEP